MGATLAKLASANRSGLSHREMVVFQQMCLTALDKPNGDKPARLYFAGWEHLASSGLGYEVPDADDDPADSRRWMKEEVRRVIARLVAAGKVERVGGQAHRGLRQCYRLHPETAISEGSAMDRKARSVAGLRGPVKHLPYLEKRPGEAPVKGPVKHRPQGTTEEPGDEEQTVMNHPARPSSRNGPVVGAGRRDNDDQTLTGTLREDRERLRLRDERLRRYRQLRADPNADPQDIRIAAELAGITGAGDE